VPVSATTTAGASVTFDLGKGASGSPTSATAPSKTAHGTISAASGTLVTYTPNACFTGTDSFAFTLTNSYGKSKPATATITVNPASVPSIEVHLIDPYLIDAYKTNPAKIPETSLYGVFSRQEVQAKGLLADGVSAAIAVVKTNSCSGGVTLATTNGTTLLPYDQTF
jgi:large repetitive protein